MNQNQSDILFGPVPSRRLGQSLGINTIHPKICTYSCIYCQIGRTNNIKYTRQKFLPTSTLLSEIKKKVKQAQQHKEQIDYFTFIPEGEPTLDKNLGQEITCIHHHFPTNKIAVITNASLLWKKGVKNDLKQADLVSLKIDTVTDKIWQKINRPHSQLKLPRILSSITNFTRSFENVIYTETMLLNKLNTGTKELEKIADFIAALHPQKSFISTPIRPTAEQWAIPATAYEITKAYQIFTEKIKDVECITTYEGPTIAYTGNIRKDLLSIAAVHPLRTQSINELLWKANQGWEVVQQLIEENKLAKITYRNQDFYIKKRSEETLENS